MDGVSTRSYHSPGRADSDGHVVRAAWSLDDGDDAFGEIEPGRTVVVDRDAIARPQYIPPKRQHHGVLFGSRMAWHGPQAHQSNAIQGSASGGSGNSLRQRPQRRERSAVESRDEVTGDSLLSSRGVEPVCCAAISRPASTTASLRACVPGYRQRRPASLFDPRHRDVRHPN